MSGDLALPSGFALNEYRIESTLGVGGFGLTYLATDSNLNLKVAIKEYLPGELAERGPDRSVTVKSEKTLDTFNWGRARFIDEARTLASFRHASIVRVMRFFEANQTAYMVMEFVAGQALNDWMGRRRPLTEKSVLGLALSLLDGLEVIHRGGYLHRDIKPNNIYIREDDSPVLLDFGSARDINTNSELTSIVSPGFAPFEQYHSQGNQGAWTDLYALGAVLYWVVTGNKPYEAAARVRKDPMPSALEASDRSRYSTELLQAIDWAIKPSEEDRPQSVAALRNALRRVETPFGPTADTSSATVLVERPPAHEALAATSQLSGGFGASVPPAFAPEILKKVETELAPHIGPIAAMLVRSAAKKSTTLAQLAERVASEIPDEKARAAFIKKFTAIEKSVPLGAPGQFSQSQPTQVLSSLLRFDADTIAKAESALSKYMGAIARVVVKRAAAKATSESELYQLLAEQIEDKEARTAFLRTAISISGRLQ